MHPSRANGGGRRARGAWLWRRHHAFAGAGAMGSGELSIHYGVTGIPHAVLVGPDGTVLAVDDGLRGDALDTTLSGIFGDPGAGASTP